jgi:hypothetical protein
MIFWCLIWGAIFFELKKIKKIMFHQYPAIRGRLPAGVSLGGAWGSGRQFVFLVLPWQSPIWTQIIRK